MLLELTVKGPVLAQGLVVQPRVQKHKLRAAALPRRKFYKAGFLLFNWLELKISTVSIKI